MTNKELEKESEEYFKSICGDYNEEYERTGKRHYWVGFDIKNAYLASAELREKRIEELEAENEQIKNSDTLCKLIGEQKRKIEELESQNNWLEGCKLELAELLGKANDKIAELEAQIEKMKWHDLEKDSNDLPENKRNVWCDYGDGCGVGYYDKDDGGWLIEGHLYCSVLDAWCELPERDKGDKRKKNERRT